MSYLLLLLLLLLCRAAAVVCKRWEGRRRHAILLHEDGVLVHELVVHGELLLLQPLLHLPVTAAAAQALALLLVREEAGQVGLGAGAAAWQLPPKLRLHRKGGWHDTCSAICQIARSVKGNTAANAGRRYCARPIIAACSHSRVPKPCTIAISDCKGKFAHQRDSMG